MTDIDLICESNEWSILLDCFVSLPPILTLDLTPSPTAVIPV